jgi:type VI secretion system secreted protein VgrG
MSDLGIEHTSDGECINMHSDKDVNVYAAHDETIEITNDRTIKVVNGKHTETIKGDTTINVTTGNFSHGVDTGTSDYYVKAAVTEMFDDTQDTIVKNNISIASTAGEILIDAAKKITLHTGDSSITLESNGTITIQGKNIKIVGGDEASLGVGNQNVKCDKQQVATSGAAINSSAVGKHEISGAVVKLN